MTTRPAVDGSPLLPQVRLALRMKSHAYDQEILHLITCCFTDLSIGGVETINIDDPLLKRAMALYCKANFGYDDPQHYRQAYEDLKLTMTLAREYGQPKE